MIDKILQHLTWTIKKISLSRFLLDSETFTGNSVWGQSPTFPLPTYKLCTPGLITNHLETLYHDTHQLHKPCTWTAISAPWLPRHQDTFSDKEPAGFVSQHLLTLLPGRPEKLVLYDIIPYICKN